MTIDLEPVKVIDADTHMTERHDLWTSRAPSALKGRMPHVADVDGVATWVVEGAVLGRAGAGGVVGPDRAKGRSFEALYEWTIDKIHPGAYDPAARLEVMDETGIGRSSSSRTWSASEVRRSRRRSKTRRCASPVSRSSTMPAPSCRRSPTTDCFPWRS